MSPTLAAGTYTIVLSDGQYVPYAVFDNWTLGDGFSDLTGDNFCNLSINGADCPNNSGAYVLDITTPDGDLPAPEPSMFLLAGTGLCGLAVLSRRPPAAAKKR